MTNETIKTQIISPIIEIALCANKVKNNGWKPIVKKTDFSKIKESNLAYFLEFAIRQFLSDAAAAANLTELEARQKINDKWDKLCNVDKAFESQDSFTSGLLNWLVCKELEIDSIKINNTTAKDLFAKYKADYARGDTSLVEKVESNKPQYYIYLEDKAKKAEMAKAINAMKGDAIEALMTALAAQGVKL